MSHWVFKAGNLYVGTRKATGRMYEARVSTTKDLDEARVFNSKPAASNSGNQAGLKGEPVRVAVRIDPPVCTCGRLLPCPAPPRRGLTGSPIQAPSAGHP